MRVVLSEPGQLCPPIWSCTSRGLPCPRCCHRGGGLLPHLFTLTGDANRGKMSRRFSSGLSPGCFAGGLFSVALSVTRLESTVSSDCATKNVPWRYQARCPSPCSSKAAGTPLARIRCPDFPPALAAYATRTSDRPAHPPALIIARIIM